MPAFLAVLRSDPEPDPGNAGVGLKTTTMEIIINNNSTDTAAANVAQLAQELALPERGVALAVNNKVVARARWEETVLTQGDSVTVIKAAFGG